MVFQKGIDFIRKKIKESSSETWFRWSFPPIWILEKYQIEKNRSSSLIKLRQASILKINTKLHHT
jgi:hypothetical protein